MGRVSAVVLVSCHLTVGACRVQCAAQRTSAEPRWLPSAASVRIRFWQARGGADVWEAAARGDDVDAWSGRRPLTGALQWNGAGETGEISFPRRRSVRIPVHGSGWCALSEAASEYR